MNGQIRKETILKNKNFIIGQGLQRDSIVWVRVRWHGGGMGREG